MSSKGFSLRLNLRIQRLQALAKKLQIVDNKKTTMPSRLKGVAFTGSRKVLKSSEDIQTKVLSNLLGNICCRSGSYLDMEMSHGDCLGWDAVAHKLAQKQHIRIHIHPPENQTMRAFCKNPNVIYPSKPYLDRNRDMVDKRGTLIAVSSTMKEEQRSGTWSTIRYARKHNKRIFIILPNGALLAEGV